MAVPWMMLQSPLDCSAGIQKVGNQASYLAFPREAKEEPLSLFCHQTGNFCWGLSFPTGAEGSSWFQLVALGRLGHLIATDSWELVCTSCSIQLLPQMLAAKAFPLGEMPRGLLQLCNNFLY